MTPDYSRFGRRDSPVRCNTSRILTAARIDAVRFPETFEAPANLRR
jgi:hypothetical protein